MAGPKELGGKTKEMAQLAQSMSQRALSESVAGGVMFEALLVRLQDKGVLDKSELDRLFYAAYAVIKQEATRSNLVQEPLAQMALETVQRVARSFGSDPEAATKNQSFAQH